MELYLADGHWWIRRARAWQHVQVQQLLPDILQKGQHPEIVFSLFMIVRRKTQNELLPPEIVFSLFMTVCRKICQFISWNELLDNKKGIVPFCVFCFWRPKLLGKQIKHFIFVVSLLLLSFLFRNVFVNNKIVWKNSLSVNPNPHFLLFILNQYW